ncbi:tyrosine-type recombinase/integrase [Mesorhizobium sp. L-8-3]|uniref:tyrosine-type recombinase/integrase n=1 Tax=Mesorhizobium sp. L-8-3 TaxID=2744522 RepID=UPI0019270C13|nr:tyrosine-type recombinase/integrase [Mesorhizobium sp. L-8-3]BCH25782.1 integrase [Mesorhizobium sp. L-8-3]
MANALEVQRKAALEAKPGGTIWILTGPTRAKLKGKRIEEPVPGTKGLYLISQVTGGQSWAFRYRRPDGKAAKLTLGTVDGTRELEPGEAPQIGEPLTKDMAVALAGNCYLKVKQKIDPAIVQRREVAETRALQSLQWEGWTVDQLFVEFMTKYPDASPDKPTRDSTKRQTAAWLGLKTDGRGGWIPNGNGVLSHWTGRTFARHDKTPMLTRKDVFAIIDQMADRPSAANHVLGALKHFGRWAEEREYVSVNPFATVRRRFPKGKRDRVLSPEEIKALWLAVSTAKDDEAIGYPYGQIALLTLVTGQRPGEVREAPFSEFDFAEREWTIPAHRAKNGRAHVVPLSQLALTLIANLPNDGSKFLFSAKGSNRPVHKQSRVKQRLDKRVQEKLGKPMPGWTYHDLRHTAYSGITALGFSRTLADEVTNHKPQGMAAIYDQHDYGPEKYAALDAWADELARITA